MAIGGVFNLVALVAFIIVLIQLFKQKGILHGILGLLCGLYTFIWGWMNASKLDAEGQKVGTTFKNWMLLWTIAGVVGFALQGVGQGG